MPKNIHIPYDLFTDLADYFSLPFPDENGPLYHRIQNGILAKEEALKKHEVYTTYKTASTHAKKAAARQEYLDRIGMKESFRSSNPNWSPWHPEE